MTLAALALAVWSQLGFGRALDAPVIAAAIEQAVGEDPRPVWGREVEAAVLAVYAAKESGVRVHAHQHDPLAFGVWQIHGAAGHDSVVDQARAWLRLLHAGAASCPAHPAAPLSGSCEHAWRLADRRLATAIAVMP